MVNPAVLLYLAIVACAGLIAVARASLWLSRLRGLRLTRLRSQERLGLLDSAPRESQEELARARGREAIERQFSVSRRLVVPLLLALTALGLALPFLPRLPAATLSALLGVLTVLLGLSARPLIENAMAGLVISHSRLFSLGDTVELRGVYGTVEDISPTHTTIKGWDWRRLVIPNTEMLRTELVNNTLFDGFIWAWVDFHVELGADLEALERALLPVPLSSEHCAADSGSEFWVMAIGERSYRCRLAAWAPDPGAAWYLKDHMNRGVIAALREAGVLPHRQHHTVEQRPG